MLTIHHALQECPEDKRGRVADSGHSEQRRRWKVFVKAVKKRERERRVINKGGLSFSGPRCEFASVKWYKPIGQPT